MASYTNWFIRYTLDVSSLNGVDPNAQPPIASRTYKRNNTECSEITFLYYNTW